MQANRCSSRSPSQKFVISAGEIEFAAKASRLDQFELHVPQNGEGPSLLGCFPLREALRLSRMSDWVAGALHLADTQLLSETFMGTFESSVHLRRSPIRSPTRAQPAAAAQ
jgi:hypothetical protein